MSVENFIKKTAKFLDSFKEFSWNDMHSRVVEIKECYKNLSNSEKSKEIYISQSQSKNIKNLMEEVLAKYIHYVLEKIKNNWTWFFRLDMKASKIDVLKQIKQRIERMKELIDFETKSKQTILEKLDLLYKELENICVINEKVSKEFVGHVVEVSKQWENFDWIRIHSIIVKLVENYTQLTSNGKVDLKFKINKPDEQSIEKSFKKQLSETIAQYISQITLEGEWKLLQSDMKIHNDYVSLAAQIEQRIGSVKELTKYLDVSDIEFFLDKNSEKQVSENLDSLHKRLVLLLKAKHSISEIGEKAYEMGVKISNGFLDLKNITVNKTTDFLGSILSIALPVQNKKEIDFEEGVFLVEDSVVVPENKASNMPNTNRQKDDNPVLVNYGPVISQLKGSLQQHHDKPNVTANTLVDTVNDCSKTQKL